MESVILEQPQALSPEDAADLAEHEAIIEAGQLTFIEVGNSLMAIRDNELYTQDTFEQYLAERWPAISTRRGYQLIDAALIAKQVPGVKNERQARALKKVPAEQRLEVYEAAEAAPGGATAQAIQSARVALEQGSQAQPVSSGPISVLPHDWQFYLGLAEDLGIGLEVATPGPKPEYMLTDGTVPRYSSQWSVIKSYLDEAQAESMASLAEAAAGAPSRALLNEASRLYAEVARGGFDLSVADGRQALRIKCIDLLEQLNILDGGQ